MILVLSTPRDEHAATVLAELAKLDAPAQLLNLAEFPQRLGLAISWAPTVTSPSAAAGASTSTTAAPSGGDGRSRRRSASASRAPRTGCSRSARAPRRSGLWHALDAFWVNNPARNHVAQRKAYQLLGWRWSCPSPPP